MTSLRALLVTDVVDSTRLAQELGDERMAALWAAHDRLARDLLVVHAGREIDKTDGFLLLFDRVEDAVAYAVAYHGALRGLGITARAGIHVGPVILTENAPADVARGAKPLEVDGLAKPIAARVGSVARGGQTLLTAEARAALGATPLRVTSHGHWRMKGVAEPGELFEVGDETAPMAPPPDGAKVHRVIERDGGWIPAREVRHHLPAERDAFVGRAADLRALAHRLDGARLVSVLGPGGTGKTRLVTRFAWSWLGDFPGGAWFCDLSEARTVEGIAAAVATALDVPLGGEDPVVRLGHAIAGRGECLVVLDNFEQVTAHAAATVGRWLDRAPDARFVVTTREVLALPGEATLALDPLLPEEAVGLFVARARQAKQDFVPDDDASIRALVDLLDGLPLAIELAAARVRLMPPKALLQRMSERFKLLASPGGRPPRHAALRATFDWGWELLAEEERRALAQLSVFEGGFTLEAAEAVLALGERWPADAVQALVDRSWVRRVEEDRFDLLASVKAYAAEKLAASGDRAEERHGAWFATFGTDDALAALHRHGGVARMHALAREIDNLAAACRRAAARGDHPTAVATLGAASAVLERRGPWAAWEELTRVVTEPGRAARPGADDNGASDAEKRREETGARARVGEPRADRWRGVVLRLLGRVGEARTHLERALAGAGGDRRFEAAVLRDLGNVQYQEGGMEAAIARYEEALVLVRAVGDRQGEGPVLGNLGAIHQIQGRIGPAREYAEQALAVARAAGNRSSEGTTLGNLSTLRQLEGRLEEAAALGEEALAVAREVGNRIGEAVVLGNLGNLARARGRLEEARARYEQALLVSREVGARASEGVVLGNLGHLLLDQRRDAEAREALVPAEGILRELGSAAGLANLLCLRARLEARSGRPEVARALLGEAEALGDALGAGPESELGQFLAEARAEVGA